MTKTTKTKTPKPVLVKEHFTVGTQSLNAERIVRVGDLKLRALIKRDAYDFQSYAQVSAWTPENGWTVVTTIPIAMTAVSQHSYVTTSPTWKDAAGKDLDALVTLGTAVLT